MRSFKFRSEEFLKPQREHWMREHDDAEDPYVTAMDRDDFPTFMALVESEREERNWSGDGALLYYIIVHFERLDMFNYLINLDNFDINYVDSFGRTLLMNIALRTESSLDQFALALIRKGANFHLADDEGNTYLHMAVANQEHLVNARLVIEEGADVDVQNNDGVTPLNMACSSNNLDMIHMLLYYGANATIPTNEGLLPVFRFSTYMEEHNKEKLTFLLKILFNHTFDDDDDITLPVINLVASMFYNEFYTKISNVTYEIFDLEVVCKVIHDGDSGAIEFLLEKFENVVEDTIKYFPLLDIVTKFRMHTFRPALWGVLKALAESRHLSTLVRNAKPAGGTIFEIVKQFDRASETYVKRVAETEITKLICLMLSYGLPVNSLDLDTVYHHYGHCELFKILLHMDIHIVPSTWGDAQMRATALYCNPGINFNDLLETCPPVLLSKFYHHPKLTKIIMKNNYKGIVDRTKMSQVPLLVELSRNVARKYIVNKYNVKNSMQFYTILNWFPVGELNKTILRLEKPLYKGVDYQDHIYCLNSWLR